MLLLGAALEQRDMSKIKLASKTQIYLDTKSLLDLILDVTPEYPRMYRYSVGCKMHDILITLLGEISAAYINNDKALRLKYLIDFQANFETLKTLVRLSIERRWIRTRGRQANIILLMENIGKQSTAWKKTLSSANGGNNSEN